jgi:hypothetical protein
VSEVAHKDVAAIKEIVALLEGEAERENDPKRVLQKTRAARLLTALIPRDCGFVVGDHVQVAGEVLFISSKENGTTTIAVSDIQRIVVSTRFVHKAPPEELSQAIAKLLEAARIDDAMTKVITGMIDQALGRPAGPDG